MNAQEIFNAVATHLFTQGERAVERGDVVCKYRAGNLKCAVGALIPDEIYDPKMDKETNGDGTGVRSLLHRFENILPSWFEDNWRLLESLQLVHDRLSSWYTTDDMRQDLKEVAMSYGLDDQILLRLSFKDR